MGDENKINLDDITLSIDLDNNYYSAHSDYLKSISDLSIGDITISGPDDVNWASYSDWIMSGDQSYKDRDNIVFTGGGEEMFKVAPDGFYVRGVKVEADAKEAEKVYKAFKEWLTYNILSSNPDDK